MRNGQTTSIRTYALHLELTQQCTDKSMNFRNQDFDMNDYNQVDKNDFLYHRYQYLGEFTPQNLIFNANLQEFSQRVSYICNFQTGGKLSEIESYKQIEKLWQQLTQSYKALGIEKNVTE